MAQNNTDKKEKKNQPQGSQNSIEQIRDIIFGDTIKEFEKKISSLKNEIVALEKRVATFESDVSQNEETVEGKMKLYDEEHQNIHEKIAAMERNFSKMVADLKKEKIDKSQIGQAFIEWGAQFKQNPGSE